jgi:hypothetical protein
MKRTIRTATEVVSATLFLLAIGGPAAFAAPAPIEPDYAPPATNGSGGGTFGIDSQMLFSVVGLVLVLVVAAIAMLAVLWHRSHAATRSLATTVRHG